MKRPVRRQQVRTGFWGYAAGHRNKTAVVDADHSVLTFGEMADMVNRTSNLLQSLGVAEGDHVSYMVGNRPEVLALILACSQIGVRYTPVSYQLVAAEVAYILQDSDAKVFIADRTAADAALAAADAAQIPAPMRLGLDGIDGFVSLSSALAGQSPQQPAVRRPGMIFGYTSGTTGHPKGVVRRSVGAEMGAVIQAAVSHAEIYGWTSDTVTLVQAPLYHIGPLSNAVDVLHVGGTVVLMDKWTATGCLERIQRYGVTGSMMVPTMLHRLLQLPDEVKAAYDVGSLHANGIVLGGAICPPDVKARMIRWWGPAFLESYGGTEALFARITSQDALEHPGSVGRGWHGVELRIVGEDGTDCAPGEIGLVYARFAGNAGFGATYHNAPAKTAASYLGEYFTLGDLGHLDEGGWLYLSDRRDDLIISGGVNVYPAEIEAVLIEHPAVNDAAVIGVPSEEWGQKAVALVELAVGAGDDEDLITSIAGFARERLAAYKCPRSIVPWPSVGRTAVGKLHRRRLRDAYLDAAIGPSGSPRRIPQDRRERSRQ